MLQKTKLVYIRRENILMLFLLLPLHGIWLLVWQDLITFTCHSRNKLLLSGRIFLLSYYAYLIQITEEFLVVHIRLLAFMVLMPDINIIFIRQLGRITQHRRIKFTSKWHVYLIRSILGSGILICNVLKYLLIISLGWYWGEGGMSFVFIML